MARTADGGARVSAETLVPPEVSRAYGCAELHVVFLQPCDDRGGPRHCVSIEIPEREADFDRAMAHAKFLDARVLIVTDTENQARRARWRAKLALPRHREVATDRALAGGWGLAA